MVLIENEIELIYLNSIQFNFVDIVTIYKHLEVLYIVK